MRLYAGAGIYAEVRVDIDQTRRDPTSACIDGVDAGRRLALTDKDDFAICNQQAGIFQPLTGTGQDGGVGNQCRFRWQRGIGGWIGIRPHIADRQ